MCVPACLCSLPFRSLNTIICNSSYVSSLRAPLTVAQPWQNTGPTNSLIVCSSPFCFPCFVYCFFVSRCHPSWMSAPAPNTSSSCWSRGRDRSRTIQDYSWPWLIWPATRTMRSAHSTTPVWSLRAERRLPKMVLEQISPPSWSWYWWETDPRSLSVPRRISPVPLQT